MERIKLSFVMRGLGPRIHDFRRLPGLKTWMAGTSPAMTRMTVGAQAS
jgi:hypothetical protein